MKPRKRTGWEVAVSDAKLFLFTLAAIALGLLGLALWLKLAEALITFLK